MNTTMLKMRAVCNKTGLSRSKIYELLGEGEFPKPVQIGKRVNLWPDWQVEAWIQDRIAAV
ncbi:helix-turn-helix transcriptional regulator [Allopontixanthobacter sediminis]|uniref:AlpA family phage regulatory protein n=1 Tax=Allopontixanthobacter sediminis TaxID=1689985 RepID=A0A845B0I3_9SPHN|nr:AlpA family phage regulatory protein [Allopontixanthobacter sediminis]MXP43696.1 AlpA family phage regulatory protein [Allopontixanthobacter sediminis]